MRIERLVVVGDRRAPRAGPDWAELGAAHGLTVLAVAAADAAPWRARVTPSLVWFDDTTGRTVGARALDRAAAHAAAWAAVSRDGSPDGVTLVVDADAHVCEGELLTGDLAADAADVVAALEPGEWDLAHLTGAADDDAALDATAYLCTTAAARALVEADAYRAGLPVEVVLAWSGLVAVAVDPPRVVASAERDALDDEPVTEHLHVLEARGLAGAARAVAALGPGALAVVVPAGRAVVLAAPDELVSVYAQVAGGEVVVAAAAEPAASVEAAGLAGLHPDTGGEASFVAAGRAGVALAGPAEAVAALLADLSGADDADDDADEDDGTLDGALVLTHAYLGGAVALDGAGVLFAVPEATRTRHRVVGGRVVDGATHASPALLVDAGDTASFDALVAARSDDPSRDLARLLRYDDAVAVAPAVAHVAASEILTVPFWTPSFCAAVIRLAEAAEAWAADPDDPVPGAEVSLAVLSPRLFAHVQHHANARVLPAVRAGWPELAPTELADAFVITYAAGPHAELRLHHDVAQISGAVRLNDGYVGGELEFPRQGWHNGEVPVGTMTLWPSLVTHPHRSRPVERGVKYGLTLWWRLPG